MPTIEQEKSDIQGIVLSGYGRFEFARFLLINIAEPVKARSWLDEWRSKVTNAEQAETIRRKETQASKTALQIALTYPGLIRLELPETVARKFAYQFQVGMTTERRIKYLGDSGKSYPGEWRWGGQGNKAPVGEAIHMLLMIYGGEKRAFEDLLAEVQDSMPPGGLVQLQELETNRLPEHKEHFGFRDGISNPGIKGVDSGQDLVEPGEFLLGYKNEYDLYAPRPLIEPSEDRHGILPTDVEGSGKHDLGRNGSFVVFRQLSQDVYGFWNEMRKAAQGTPLGPVALAAKMVGRWPNGTPLTVSPDGEEPELETKNDFKYHAKDPYGLKCPDPKVPKNQPAA